MKNRIRGTLLLSFATLIWGSAFIAQRSGMDSVGPFTFQTIRCALAVLFLFPAATLSDRRLGLRAALRRWRDRKLWQGGGLCGIALFVASSLQQMGLVETDAGKAGFLTAMYIILVPLLGIFLKRRPSRAALVSVLPAGVGLYLLSWSGGGGFSHGDLLLLGSALAFSVQITLIDRFASTLDGLHMNCVQALVVTVLSIPFAWTTETVSLPAIMECRISLLYAGVLSMGVAYTLQIVGQRELEPTAASVIMSLESVFAVLFGWLLLNEQLTLREGIGCLLLFAAVLLAQLPDKKRKKV